MRSLALVAVLAAAFPASAGSSPVYDRALMVRADELCRLFDPEVGRALKVASMQARNAALRAGASAGALDAIEARAAARAAAAGCGSAELRTAAGRVRTAYAGWGRQLSLDVDGPWRVRRTVLTERWRLSQSASAGADLVTLGLTSGDGRPTAAVRFTDGRTPSTARLRYRDLGRDARPDLSGVGPGPTARMLWASEARGAPSGLTAGQGRGSGRLYRWPAATAAALAALDPREHVAVEFVFPGPGGREEVRAARFRVGDLAVALAFLENEG